MVIPEVVRLEGRVGVVTGAANGIGRATALALARFGMDVAACDRDADGLETLSAGVREMGRGVHTEALDVRDLAAVEVFAASVRERFGGVDAVVNNAGGTFRADFMAASPKGDRALVDENFTSVVNVIRSFVPLMEGRAGSIVNVTSSEGFQAAPGFAVYGAMKTAQESLTRTLALELAEQGDPGQQRVPRRHPDQRRPATRRGRPGGPAVRPAPRSADRVLRRSRGLRLGDRVPGGRHGPLRHRVRHPCRRGDLCRRWLAPGRGLTGAV